MLTVTVSGASHCSDPDEEEKVVRRPVLTFAVALRGKRA